MRILKYISFLLVFAWQINTSYAQFAAKDEVVKAMLYLQQNELDSAKKYIDLAVEKPELQNKQSTWFYRGYIYKALYKEREKNNKFSPFREESVRSYKKSLALKQDEQFTQNTIKALKYLAASYYNDAALSIKIDKDAATADKCFKKYKQLTALVNPNEDLKRREVEYYLALATLYNSQEPTDTTFNQDIADKAIKIYEQVLALDSNNASAYYNLGILYYNKAASLINKMDYDEPLDVVNEKLDQCVALFLKALPYMQKAYDLNFRREDVLEGLMGIYYGLNDDDKYAKYKAELDTLKKSNK